MSSRLGHHRERQVRHILDKQGWLAFRAPASLGVADVVALRAGSTPLLIEVKATTRSPWVAFGPRDRDELKSAAWLAGAEPLLAWWPPRGHLQWIGVDEWPT